MVDPRDENNAEAQYKCKDQRRNVQESAPEIRGGGDCDIGWEFDVDNQKRKRDRKYSVGEGF